MILLINLTNTSKADFKIRKIIDLNDPWGSSFINEDNLIVTEKSGKIKLINLNSKTVNIIQHNLNFLEHGQGGLLDILYDDEFIYLSYSENRGNSKTSTSVAKAKFKKKKFDFQKYFSSKSSN